MHMVERKRVAHALFEAIGSNELNGLLHDSDMAYIFSTPYGMPIVPIR